MNAPQLINLGKTAKHDRISICAPMASRHGLIAGATGTGKTVTLQTLAEGFSRIGTAVFAADVKGDLSGLGAPATLSPKLLSRIEQLRIGDYKPTAAPILFWDVYGQQGHPLRTTISEVGPLLLGRILELGETQASVLQLAFKIADDQGLLLLDCKDLHQLLLWLAENSKLLKEQYGSIAPATLGVIQRAVLNLEQRGGEKFFSEPALRLEHLCQSDSSGRGLISILDATRLLQDPLLYSTFLVWLLSELFEELPEVGDLEKPKLVFFFDEAHLLFRDAPSSLCSKIEQVVRLIRSKGVGVYFVTQNPSDIPEAVLAQLNNRVQHALRAYTPNEQKAVRAAAGSFRQNPEFSTQQAISELEVGEALVSVLDQQGKPSMVERVMIAPPHSQIGPLEPQRRSEIIRLSPLAGLYDQMVDRQSAFEILKQRKSGAANLKTAQPESKLPSRKESTHSSSRQSVGEALLKSVVRSVGSSLGRQLVRGILGSLSR